MPNLLPWRAVFRNRRREGFDTLKLAEMNGPNDYLRAPRIERADVRLLWHDDFWDGPLSGMLMHRGQECWFQMIAENEDEAPGWYRRFAVLQLSPEQHAEEHRWHMHFQRCVGGHCDYQEDGSRPVGTARHREQWAEFYDAYQQRAPRDFSACEVIGWFEL